jgi:acetyl-CoA synthetase
LLLPATAADIHGALRSLRIWPLLNGSRGRPVDLDSVVDAVLSILDCARHHVDRLVEMEVNPLLVLPDGVMAVDALILLGEARSGGPSASREVELEDAG